MKTQLKIYTTKQSIKKSYDQINFFRRFSLWQQLPEKLAAIEDKAFWLESIRKNIVELQKIFKPEIGKTYFADFGRNNYFDISENGRTSINFLYQMTSGSYKTEWDSYSYKGPANKYNQGKAEMVECFYCNSFYFHIDEDNNTIITESSYDSVKVKITIPQNIFDTDLIAGIESINY